MANDLRREESPIPVDFTFRLLAVPSKLPRVVACREASRLSLVTGNFLQDSIYVMTGVHFNNFDLFPAFVDSHGDQFR